MPAWPEQVPPAEWREARVRYPYRDRDAVGPVSLKLRAGESTLLLGPSGAGKSTLLASLTGIVPQTIPADFRAFDPARDYLWPIPQKELDLNPELGQNPGY